MTWFGIALVVYYILNLLAGAWGIGRGGIEATPADLAFTMFLQVGILVLLFTVGTNV